MDKEEQQSINFLAQAQNLPRAIHAKDMIPIGYCITHIIDDSILVEKAEEDIT